MCIMMFSEEYKESNNNLQHTQQENDILNVEDERICIYHIYRYVWFFVQNKP